MRTLPENIVERLIEIEADIHYAESAPDGQPPFVVIGRDSPVILSAPHGAKTFRNNGDEIWHDEDEYTAGMALLLSEVCGTSVIATVWRTDDSDPNEHDEKKSAYKQELRRLAVAVNARWIIDLHGAGEDSPRLFGEQKVELGTGNRDEYLPPDVCKTLIAILNKRLGKGVAYRNGMPGFRAAGKDRIAAFAYYQLGLGSVQIEMKPSVRVALRRTNSSAYRRGKYALDGSYSAPKKNMIGMLGALAEFIEYLRGR